MRDHLELIDFIENRKVLEGIKLWVQLVDRVNTLVHPHDQLANALDVILLKVLKLVDMHEFVRIVGRLLYLVFGPHLRNRVVGGGHQGIVDAAFVHELLLLSPLFKKLCQLFVSLLVVFKLLEIGVPDALLNQVPNQNCQVNHLLCEGKMLSQELHEFTHVGFR